jgi:hypothetical protein
VGMLYYWFECVLIHCVLEEKVYVRLGSVDMPLYSIVVDVGLLHIL